MDLYASPYCLVFLVVPRQSPQDSIYQSVPSLLGPLLLFGAHHSSPSIYLSLLHGGATWRLMFITHRRTSALTPRFTCCHST